MIPLFKALTPGLHTSIQDQGRRGYQSYGVPVSGPLDRIAFRLANALAGNEPNAPALEIVYSGPVLEVVAASARAAFVGGGAGLLIGGGGRRIPPGRTVKLQQGETLEIAPLAETACGYLAVEGGFEVPLCLGSAATYARGNLGGVEGRALMAGDVLHGRLASAPEREETALAARFEPGLERAIRVVMGPQDDRFTSDAQKLFLSSRYRVSPRSDRIGMRLDGPRLTHKSGADIVTEGVTAGCIQVPASGEPVILLADSQTAGGYAKIATVISADLPLAARRPPGAVIRFEAESREAAEAARRAQEAALEQVIAGFVTPQDEASLDASRLYEANLIGGVVSAKD